MTNADWVYELARQGKGRSAIMAALGMSHRTLLRAIATLREQGRYLPALAPETFWTDERLEVVRRMLADGATSMEIAAVLGRTPEAVRSRIVILRREGGLSRASAPIGASPTPPAADPPAGSPHPAKATACPNASITPAEVNPREGCASGVETGRVGAGQITDRYVLSLLARGEKLENAKRQAELYRQRRAA
ncbi:hypothetical protein [Rhodovarius lipocyclicus]|uniref:hypothetical protein n=1 Tax=Rhodovarius lipocyclicus TaxID=268410 RepID=UPI00135756F4|nr:hypothetical protein [Rhodovarius lipocyclicus]